MPIGPCNRPSERPQRIRRVAFNTAQRGPKTLKMKGWGRTRINLPAAGHSFHFANASSSSRSCPRIHNHSAITAKNSIKSNHKLLPEPDLIQWRQSGTAEVRTRVLWRQRTLQKNRITLKNGLNRRVELEKERDAACAAEQKVADELARKPLWC